MFAVGKAGSRKKRPSLRQICVGGGANTKRQFAAVTVMGSIHGKSMLRQSTPSSLKSCTLHRLCFPITMLEKKLTLHILLKPSPRHPPPACQFLSISVTPIFGVSTKARRKCSSTTRLFLFWTKLPKRPITNASKIFSRLTLRVCHKNAWEKMFVRKLES